MDTVMTQAKPSATWRLAPGWRKGVLVLHVIAGIGWMGVDIAVFVLLMTARTSADPILVVSGFNAIRLIVPVAVPPLSLTILITGLLLGLGTSWGLIRYWWVLVKLCLSLIMTVLAFLSLVPGVNTVDSTVERNGHQLELAVPIIRLPPPLIWTYILQQWAASGCCS